VAQIEPRLDCLVAGLSCHEAGRTLSLDSTIKLLLVILREYLEKLVMRGKGEGWAAMMIEKKSHASILT